MRLGRRGTRARLADLPGVRTVRRPVGRAGGEFDLYYVRNGPRSSHPLVIIPGGPGMASIASYRGLRRRAAAAGLDVIMVEHRGVGLSRRDDAGTDLPPDALTIEQVVDDLDAVLDDAGVGSAVIYGTSYGSYLAAGMGVRHPRRVHAMILDSPLLNRDDIEIVRAELRDLLWVGRDPETSPLATKVRTLNERGAMTPADAQLAAALYGIGGAALLHRVFDLLLDGRNLLWTAMRRIGHLAATRTVPFRNESDLVGPIGFRELNFHGEPDGLPLDPAVAMRESAADEPPSFEAEPFDLVADMPSFRWPTVVISGGRDLTTPPAVAERIAGLIPGASLVRLPTAGHSILDTREQAALRIAADVTAGRGAAWPSRGGQLDLLPVRGELRVMSRVIDVAARLEGAMPRIRLGATGR